MDWYRDSVFGCTKQEENILRNEPKQHYKKISTEGSFKDFSDSEIVVAWFVVSPSVSSSLAASILKHRKYSLEIVLSLTY